MKHKVVLGVFTFKGEFPGKKSDMMVSMWRRKDFNLAADFWVEFDLPDNLDYSDESVDNVRRFLSEHILESEYLLRMGMNMSQSNEKERFFAILDMFVDRTDFEFDVKLVTQYEGGGEKKYVFAVVVTDKNLEISFVDPNTNKRPVCVGKKSLAFIEEAYDGKPLPNTNSRLLYNFAVDLFKS